MSAIFVDSYCDLSSIELKKLGLNLVDLDDIDPFKTAITPYLDEQEDIIYFASQLKLVSTKLEDFLKYFNANYEARKIKVIDLNVASVCAGLIVYEIGLSYRRGCTDSEIIKISEDFRKQVYGLFVTQSSEFLKSCKGIEKINNNSTLNLVYPIVCIRENRQEILDKTQGKKRAFSVISHILGEYGTNMADYPIIIGYYNDENNAQFLKEMLIKQFGKDTTVLTIKIYNKNAVKYGDNSILMAFYSKHIN